MFTPRSRTCAYKTAPGLVEWPSRDPRDEEGGLDMYDFVVNNSPNYIDSLGKSVAPTTPTPGTLTITVTTHGKSLSSCGASTYVVKWNVSGSVNGYVLQHIKTTVQVTDCEGNGVVTANGSHDFTEAWQITGGGSGASGDQFTTADEGENRKGSILSNGKVKFIENYILTGNWGHDPEANGLPTFPGTPPVWSDAGTQIHASLVTFNCCCKNRRSTSVTTIP